MPPSLHLYTCLLLASPWSIFASPSKILPRQEITPILKRGLAWGGGDANITQYEKNNNVGWFYTWNTQNWVRDSNTLEFVPMLWGAKQIADFPATVNQTSVASGVVKHILGMNEPEHEGQSALTPQQAAEMWRTYIEPAKSWNPAVRLGSPAMSAATRSKQWLMDFGTACSVLGGCSTDFLALHWYGINATQFIGYMEEMHNIFQLNIWVTEFACHEFGADEVQCTYDQAVTFMNEAQAWLDATPYIERYAWFGAMKQPVITNVNALMGPDGVINNLGLQYIGLRDAASNIGGTASIPSSMTVPDPLSTAVTVKGGKGGSGMSVSSARSRSDAKRLLGFAISLAIFPVFCLQL